MCSHDEACVIPKAITLALNGKTGNQHVQIYQYMPGSNTDPWQKPSEKRVFKDA
jgi:hypothetical protein